MCVCVFVRVCVCACVRVCVFVLVCERERKCARVFNFSRLSFSLCSAWICRTFSYLYLFSPHRPLPFLPYTLTLNTHGHTHGHTHTHTHMRTHMHSRIHTLIHVGSLRGRMVGCLCLVANRWGSDMFVCCVLCVCACVICIFCAYWVCLRSAVCAYYVINMDFMFVLLFVLLFGVLCVCLCLLVLSPALVSHTHTALVFFLWFASLTLHAFYIWHFHTQWSTATLPHCHIAKYTHNHAHIRTATYTALHSNAYTHNPGLVYDTFDNTSPSGLLLVVMAEPIVHARWRDMRWEQRDNHGRIC